jgi:hypothetical protein
MTKVNRGPAYAKALLAELKILGSPDPRDVAAQLQLDVTELTVQGFDGSLVRAMGTPFGAIIVRDSIREFGRKSFTIAHEIGHFVIPGHDVGGAVCGPSDIGNWADSSRELEREADEFAAELLLPADIVKPKFRAESPSLKVIQTVANESNVSLSATAWRYCDLVTERCAIVWSRNGKISWYKPSQEFGFYLMRGWEISKGTQAWECFSGARSHECPEAVSANLWLDERVIGENSVLWEHSIGLPYYESVLSLLWINSRIERYSDDDDPEPEEADPYRLDSMRRRRD